MARKAEVRFFASRNAYYCQIGGKQIRLGDGPKDDPHGPNYLAAFEVWKGLIRLQHADAIGDANTVRVVGELYLRHCEGRKSAATLRMRTEALVAFCETFGEMPVSHVKPFAVSAWCDSLRAVRTGKPLSSTSKGMALASIRAAFSWAREQGLTKTHPLERMAMPRRRQRGATVVLTDDERERVLASATRYFRPVAILLDATGCRPGEISAMEARHFDPAKGTVTFLPSEASEEGDFAHKTASKGKARTIYLTGEALETVRVLAERYPNGPIFRNKHGKGWTRFALCSNISRLRERLNLPHLLNYSFRHTFATKWILSGRSVDLLAAILGNTAQVIRQHYAHLLENVDVLQAAAQDFARERQSDPLALDGGDVQPCVVIRP